MVTHRSVHCHTAWSNLFFYIFFDIRALWRSVQRASVPECQKINKVGYIIMAVNTLKCKCNHLTPLGLKGLKYTFSQTGM